jgi:hypothetical protein
MNPSPGLTLQGVMVFTERLFVRRLIIKVIENASSVG